MKHRNADSKGKQREEKRREVRIIERYVFCEECDEKV